MTDVLYTTYNMLRNHGPCLTGFEDLLMDPVGRKDYGHDEPFPFTTIFAGTTLENTIWSFRGVLPEYELARDLLVVDYHCDVAVHVIGLYNEAIGVVPASLLINALAVRKLHARGLNSIDDLTIAHATITEIVDGLYPVSRGAGGTGDGVEAYKAASTALAAMSVLWDTWAALWQGEVREWQKQHLLKYLKGEIS